MNKLKRIVCILLTLCFTVVLSSCGEKPPQEATPSGTTENAENREISVLSLNKEYISDYEWYKDTSTMLVRSEYTDVTLDKAMEKDYPLLSKALAETSVMRKRTMEDEKDNFIALATDEFESNNEAFSTYVSTLDVQVRRADSVAVSILEDYGKEDSRSFNGLNYDTESGKELALADVFADTSEIPATVEKEIMSRIGEDEPSGDTAVIEYFKNTPDDSITWTLDYNGVAFYFNPGDIAPTNFGIQVVTVTFAEYPDLFNEKYTIVPDEYVVSLPASAPFYADITGDKKTEELTVSGHYDEDTKFYHTISINAESSEFEAEWFSYIEPYYVKTKDGKSYLCVFSVNNEEEGKDFTLSVYNFENGKVKLLTTSKTGLDSKGENIFALPTDPSEPVSVR
ncbi:MAG: DUF3298 domain-containing protein [Clostridia bacterium]|nr:DUF3298 domain-containing protein [Clostridia bacterium]